MTAILRRREFWIPSLALISSSGLCQAVVTTVPVYAIQLGYGLSRTGMLFAFAVSAGLTKVGAGLLADRLPPRLLLIASCLLLMASQLMLLLMPNALGLTAGSALAGASLGCALPTAGRMMAASFGASQFGAVMGWTYAGMSAAAIAAPLFIGHVYDTHHAYGTAFVTFLAVSGAVLGVAIFLKPRPA